MESWQVLKVVNKTYRGSVTGNRMGDVMGSEGCSLFQFGRGYGEYGLFAVPLSRKV